MHTAPNKCPICGGEITVTRLACRDCDTTFEGRFSISSFSQLSGEQLHFIETFVRCEGKINRMEGELGISYPTIRNRLHEVIRALGYEPGGTEETTGLSPVERQQILEQLDKGTISVEDAMNLLQENEA